MTGHMVDSLKDILNPKLYEPIPDHLASEAKKKLKGKKETVIDLKSKERLAVWAKGIREKKKMYPNYLQNQQLRRRLKREGVTGIKIVDGVVQ